MKNLIFPHNVFEKDLQDSVVQSISNITHHTRHPTISSSHRGQSRDNIAYIIRHSKKFLEK